MRQVGEASPLRPTRIQAKAESAIKLVGEEIGLHQRPDEGGTPFDKHLLTRQSPWRLIGANAPIPTAAVPWSWLMFDFTQLPNALC